MRESISKWINKENDTRKKKILNKGENSESERTARKQTNNVEWNNDVNVFVSKTERGIGKQWRQKVRNRNRRIEHRKSENWFDGLSR